MQMSFGDQLLRPIFVIRFLATIIVIVEMWIFKMDCSSEGLFIRAIPRYTIVVLVSNS